MTSDPEGVPKNGDGGGHVCSDAFYTQLLCWMGVPALIGMDYSCCFACPSSGTCKSGDDVPGRKKIDNSRGSGPGFVLVGRWNVFMEGGWHVLFSF